MTKHIMQAIKEMIILAIENPIATLLLVSQVSVYKFALLCHSYTSVILASSSPFYKYTLAIVPSSLSSYSVSSTAMDYSPFFKNHAPLL